MNEEILRPGDRGPAVRRLRALLTENGFPCPEGDLYDGETADRVAAFRESRGLTPGREADSRTRALLTLLAGNDPDEMVFYGDADANGMLTAKDALLVVKSLLSSGRGAQETAALDANGDGKLDGKDALFLIRCLLGRERVRTVRTRDGGPMPEREPLPLAEVLETETPFRRALVTEALRYAYDPLTEPVREYPRSLYLWGADLYTEEKKLFCPAPKDIDLAALRWPAFFNEGRREMMLRALARADGPLPASDCSGAIVGLWRLFGVCAPEFDAPANRLITMGEPIPAESLRPGDLVGFPGHIGLYAGGGFVVEWVGGAYGCQLTRLGDRRCWSFTENRLIVMKKQFESFARPAYPDTFTEVFPCHPGI